MQQDATTLDTHYGQAGAHSAGVTMTVLWHDDPARIGRSAAVAFADGAPAQLSRLAPIFDDGAPLDHPGASRTPLSLAPDGQGLRIWPGRSGLRFSVDGQPGPEGYPVSPEQLGAGVVLGLGARGPLVLIERGLREPEPTRHGLIGGSANIQRVRAEIDRLAPLPWPVLVRGPTGTGKELVSAALHARSGRRGPMVPVNAAALSPGTATSQLFGHARGAFTGADRPSGGFFSAAEGGTLFLDEIGACTTELQAQLLRALESGEIQPVGGKTRRADVRVIAATDEDLDAAIADGGFRRALYHRLAHGQITLQALRYRPADIATQAVHFLRQALATVGAGEMRVGWLTRAGMQQLLAHPWSGNTRELRATCEQLAARYGAEPTCGLADLSAPPTAAPRPAPSTVEAKVAPATDTEEALRRCGWRIDLAARELGVSRNTIKRRMARLGLPRPSALTRAEIEGALADADSLEAAAMSLRVSAHGLKLRVSELGIARG